MISKFLFFFVATILAYFAKGITGFGNTLVMSPLFSFVTSNRLTTPVDLLLSLPANAWMAYRERRHISLKIVIPLSLLLIAGIIPGALLLKTGNDWLLKSVLGVVVIAMAVEMLLRKPAGNDGHKTSPVWLAVIGIISGVLCGLYGIGALLVAYISRTTDSLGAFRANLCCVFLVENLFRLVWYSASGIMTGEALLLSLLLLPAAAIGLFAGLKLSKKLKPEITKKTVVALLGVSGTVLFISNAFFH
jgi:uncharacterized protein